jgi:tetratricopeptide (TPR) repeat protein
LKIPLHLHRCPANHPAVALLLEGADSSILLHTCARLGLDPAGRVFAVEGGLVLRLDRPLRAAFPGAVRLRAVAGNMLVPVDAEPVPALLQDEAAGLTRDRGIVLLPDGRVLGFDARAPLDPGTLLTARARPRRDWQPLPEPPRLAERIEEILVAMPGGATGEEAAEAALGPVQGKPGAGAGAGAGEGLPRPDGTSAGMTLIGRGWAALGAALIAFGSRHGFERVARLGARWVGRAVEMVPRLSEDILGRQAAALRELLQQFRDGKLEDALGHALPLGEPGGPRGAGVDTSDRLPARDISYLLRSLLGGNERGPGSVWLGHDDVMLELAKEYRKAAELAIARGDHRRAASIYGRLLRDYRSAAHALLRGGLYRDAAAVFLAKLDDKKAAARAFESAGEIDRAVDLYRQSGEHEQAGDLLSRVGEREAALAEYRTAAETLAASSAGHLAAGNLMLRKAQNSELALEYFQRGWELRPATNSVLCGINIVMIYHGHGRFSDLLDLISEADEFFGSIGDPSDAGRFYNEMAAISVGLTPDQGDELRDRALLGIAGSLRRQVEVKTRPQTSVSTLLANPGRWPAALIQDAEFALKAADARAVEAPSSPTSPSVRRIGSGVVTAVAAGLRTDEVFVGFDGGTVYCYRPGRSEVALVSPGIMPVVSISVAPNGSRVAVLWDESGRAALSTFERTPNGSYRLLLGLMIETHGSPWLTPMVATATDYEFGLWDGEEMAVMEAGTLLSRSRFEIDPDATPTIGHLIIRPDIPEGRQLLFAAENRWYLASGLAAPAMLLCAMMGPRLPPGSSLLSTPLATIWQGVNTLRLAWISDFGTLCWGSLVFADYGSIRESSWATSGTQGGYRAAGLLSSDDVVGVHGTKVDRFRESDDRLLLTRSRKCDLDGIVACVPRQRGGLVLINSDGFAQQIEARF